MTLKGFLTPKSTKQRGPTAQACLTSQTEHRHATPASPLCNSMKISERQQSREGYSNDKRAIKEIADVSR
jgi:hypothetical protein